MFILILIVGYIGWQKRSLSYGYSVLKEAGDFYLLDQDNQRKSLKDFREKKIFLFFGYIQCKTSCPPSIGVFTSLSKKITDKDLNFIFISLDSENDQKNASQFAKHFDERFFLLTGEKKEIQNAALGYEVFQEKDQELGELNHTGHIFLLDQSSRLRRIYPSNFRDINRIIKDYSQLELEK